MKKSNILLLLALSVPVVGSLLGLAAGTQNVAPPQPSPTSGIDHWLGPDVP